MFCRKCGKEVDEGQRFCRHCGEEVVGLKGRQQTDCEVDTADCEPVSEAKRTSKSKFKKACMFALSVVGILCVVGYFVEYGVEKPSIEKQTEEFLKDVIREKLLDVKFSPYIELDRIEDYKLERKQASDISIGPKPVPKKNKPRNKPYKPFFSRFKKNKYDRHKPIQEYTGTAKVVFRARHGLNRTEIFVFNVKLTPKADGQIELSCKPKDEVRFAEKFDELLESAGYEEGDDGN